MAAAVPLQYNITTDEALEEKLAAKGLKGDLNLIESLNRAIND
jgi:hypothetical protein